ncbi:thermonuclease family protein [Phenylobacterium terrae]|uniref:Thermonuclease family protein n=1 Tax=Phenylobacterium terrae TaxID=2665495 RepID=A0ABW4N7N8_9CAUL
MRRRLAAIVLALVPAAGHADPCEGPLPARPGVTVSGTVRYVGDGDSLCVGDGPDPARWVEVRLADFDAPELRAPGGADAKARLARLVLGRPIACVTSAGRNGRVRVHDRVIARCKVAGRPLGAQIRALGGRDGGR